MKLNQISLATKYERHFTQNKDQTRNQWRLKHLRVEYPPLKSAAYQVY